MNTIWVLSVMYVNMATGLPHYDMFVFTTESACIMAAKITPSRKENHIPLAGRCEGRSVLASKKTIDKYINNQH